MQDHACLISDTLGTQIREVINLYCEDGTFKEAMLRVLVRPGFALHPQAACSAGIVALETYRAVSGPPDMAAFRAAAAVELHMQAAYLFDHVADGDQGPGDGLAPAEELAVATALLICGQSAMQEAAFSARLSVFGLGSVRRWAADCLVKCCTGQFLDAYLEKRPSATADESLRMTSLKAGSLGRFATGLGATMAAAELGTVEVCGEFGFNLFTYFQLVDDLRDACPKDGGHRDLAQHKKTLPVVFFRNWKAERNRGTDCSIIPPEVGDNNTVDTRQEYEASGARIFGAITAEAFLNRAKGNLADLKTRLGTVGNLERFVSAFEISPQEIALSC